MPWSEFPSGVVPEVWNCSDVGHCEMGNMSKKTFNKYTFPPHFVATTEWMCRVALLNPEPTDAKFELLSDHPNLFVTIHGIHFFFF